MRPAIEQNHYALQSDGTDVGDLFTISGNIVVTTEEAAPLGFLQLALQGAGNGVVSGNIGAGAGGLTNVTPLDIVKNDGGTWTLSGSNNTYTGTTSVNGGKLQVNGTHSGAGAYSVNNGGTLGGTGAINTAGNAGVTVGSGGKLSPGAAIGTLSMNLGTGQLNIGAAATAHSPSLLFELGQPGMLGSSDQIVLTNSSSGLNIGNGVLEFDDFQFTPRSGFGPGVYTLIDTGHTITGSLGSNLSGAAGANRASISLDPSSRDVLLTVQSDLFARLVVDRATGGMTLMGASDLPTGILGYSITSDIGALNKTGWTPIAGHYDAPSHGGNASVDSDDAWAVLSANNQHVDLSEAMVGTGNGGSLGVNQSVNLGSSAWIQNIQEDVQIEFLLANGTLAKVPVMFTGGSGDPYQRSDLDFDAGLDGDDWQIFMAGEGMNLSGLSPAQAYQKGDLNYDGFQDSADLALFMADYDAANGPGAFDMLVNPLAGDYNDDGIVDAADYTVWRDHLGGSSLLNETVSLGVVDQADYVEWKSHFGNTGGAGAGAVTAGTVPEPAGLLLVGIGMLAAIGSRRRSGDVVIA